MFYNQVLCGSDKAYLTNYAVKKKISDFPVPGQNVTNQTLPGQE